MLCTLYREVMCSFALRHCLLFVSSGSGRLQAAPQLLVLPSQTDIAQIHTVCPCISGTPLGDPTEVGAAVAVLLDSQGGRRSALAFLSSKSAVGHAEPAAGELRNMSGEVWIRQGVRVGGDILLRRTC